MKHDQMVRIAGILSLPLIYAAHVGLNGSGPIKTGIAGEMSPFALVVVAVVILALPEVLDRMPFGPTRAPPKKPTDDNQ